MPDVFDWSCVHNVYNIFDQLQVSVDVLNEVITIIHVFGLHLRTLLVSIYLCFRVMWTSVK